MTVGVFPNRILGVSLPSGQRVDISISNSSQAVTSSNNLVAYRPRFSDHHRSGLGAMFFNVRGIFPCVGLRPYFPPCGILTSEEDGFNDGRSFIQAADYGNSFRVFSSTENIPTYGFALEGCAEFTASCWPEYFQITIFCLLPRHLCG